MLKINEFLDRTGKTVGAVASITLGVAVISIGAVVIRDHIKSLFRRSRHCKGKIIVCKVERLGAKESKKYTTDNGRFFCFRNTASRCRMP